ncbi:hypothetical protein FOA52_002044 [Chlamydomonas sp. UWO 241]|nr:hypothetical protein FOA52_002044 [Chlamydomonas sp. UWO 241]
MGKLTKSTRKFVQAKGKGSGGGKGSAFGKKHVKTRHVAPPRRAGGGGSVKAGELGAEEKKEKRRLEDMGVDEFLDGGFASGDDSGSDDGSDDDDMEDEDEEDEDGEGEDGDDDADVEEEEEDDDDDDEVVGGKEHHPVSKDNQRLKGENDTHRSQLEALKARDPEFYAYLQQTDAGLLDFQDDDEANSEDEGGEGAEEETEEAGLEGDPEESAGPSGRITVTSALVTKWCEAAKKGAPLGTMRSLVKAYRMACHYGDSEEEVATSMKIASAAVYNQLMLFMLKDADGLFRRMLGIDKKSAGATTVADLTKSSKWRKVGPLIKSYWGNSLHLLTGITDAPLLAFALRRLRASVLLVGPTRKLADKFLKACLDAFGSGEVAPRVQAFLAVRALAVAVPEPYLERCLKGMYRTFLANSKFVSAASAPHIAFMSTCCVELWGLDMPASYNHAFGAIRQLALSLRSALSMKTPDSYKEIYSWQGVNCLELWSKILGAHADKAELRPLVYPLAQLLLGSARLVPTPRFFPLRLRVIRALSGLAQATGFFIPVAPLLLEMLHWAELHKPPRSQPGAGGMPDMALQLRAGKSVLRTPQYQEEVITQVQELLTDHLSQWACSIAFPELSHMSLLQLRRFAKTSTVERFRRSTKQLVDAIDRNAKWVGTHRDCVDFSPKDVSRVNEFLRTESAAGKAPMQVFNAQLAARAAQRAAMRRTDDMTIKKGKRKGRDDDSDDDEDNDEAAVRKGDDSDGDDDIDMPMPIKKKAKKTAAQAALSALGDDGGEDGGDVVRDYEMSDEDEEEEESEEGGTAAASDDDSDDDDEDEGEDEDNDMIEGSDGDGSDDGPSMSGDEFDGGEGEEESEDFVDMMRGAGADSGSDDDGEGGGGGGRATAGAAGVAGAAVRAGAVAEAAAAARAGAAAAEAAAPVGAVAAADAGAAKAAAVAADSAAGAARADAGAVAATEAAVAVAAAAAPVVAEEAGSVAAAAARAGAVAAAAGEGVGTAAVAAEGAAAAKGGVEVAVASGAGAAAALAAGAAAGAAAGSELQRAASCRAPWRGEL